MDLRWGRWKYTYSRWFGAESIKKCIFQTALFAVTAEYRIKYEFPYGNRNYFWQNAWYPPLFNSGQGLIKRIVQIKGIAEKEAMKKPHFGINAVFRLQLSSIKKNAFNESASSFTKTTNEHSGQCIAKAIKEIKSQPLQSLQK